MYGLAAERVGDEVVAWSSRLALQPGYWQCPERLWSARSCA